MKILGMEVDGISAFLGLSVIFHAASAGYLACTGDATLATTMGATGVAHGAIGYFRLS